MRKTISMSLVVALGTVSLSGAAQAWTLKTLHEFCCEFPTGHLVRDSATGDLYGATDNGGTYDAGTIFKVSQNGNETVLYRFRGRRDGGTPRSAPVMDNAGNLFGTAAVGGEQDGGVLYRL